MVCEKCFWLFDPFLKITKWKASRIITLNSSVQPILKFSKEKEIQLPAAAGERREHKENSFPKEKFNVLSIGRFVPLKGFDMTVEAFGHFYHRQSMEDQNRLQLTLIGKRTTKEKLEKLVQELQIESAVTFIDWMTQSELDEYFKKSSVFFFPSHEGAGMVVPEALSYGLPILCYDNIGPGEFINETCGRKIPYSFPRESIVTFSEKLNILFHEIELQKELSEGAIQHFEKYFTWERKGEVISQAYLDVLFPNQKRKISLLQKEPSKQFAEVE